MLFRIWFFLLSLMVAMPATLALAEDEAMPGETKEIPATLDALPEMPEIAPPGAPEAAPSPTAPPIDTMAVPLENMPGDMPSADMGKPLDETEPSAPAPHAAPSVEPVAPAAPKENTIQAPPPAQPTPPEPAMEAAPPPPPPTAAQKPAAPLNPQEASLYQRMKESLALFLSGAKPEEADKTAAALEGLQVQEAAKPMSEEAQSVPATDLMVSHEPAPETPAAEVPPTAEAPPTATLTAPPASPQPVAAAPAVPEAPPVAEQKPVAEAQAPAAENIEVAVPAKIPMETPPVAAPATAEKEVMGAQAEAPIAVAPVVAEPVHPAPSAAPPPAPAPSTAPAPVAVAPAPSTPVTPPARVKKTVAPKSETATANPPVRRASRKQEEMLYEAYRALLADKPAEALKQYQKVAAQNPGNVDAAFGIAVSYHRTYEYKKAFDAYVRVLSLAPNHKDAIHNLEMILPKLATADKKRGLLTVAKKMGNKTPATIHGQIAAAYMDEGDYKQAITSLKKAIKADPDSIAYRYNSAVAYDHMGNRLQAIVAYQQVVDAANHGTPIGQALPPIQSRLNYLKSQQK